MNEIALKLCDIQGRLFELSADHNYGSMEFIKMFMTLHFKLRIKGVK